MDGWYKNFQCGCNSIIPYACNFNMDNQKGSKITKRKQPQLCVGSFLYMERIFSLWILALYLDRGMKSMRKEIKEGKRLDN